MYYGIFYIDKCLFLSHEHMPGSAADFGDLEIVNMDNGIMVPHTDPRIPLLPKWIQPVMEVALKADCEHLFFIFDYPIYPELPTYDWDCEIRYIRNFAYLDKVLPLHLNHMPSDKPKFFIPSSPSDVVLKTRPSDRRRVVTSQPPFIIPIYASDLPYCREWFKPIAAKACELGCIYITFSMEGVLDEKHFKVLRDKYDW